MTGSPSEAFARRLTRSIMVRLNLRPALGRQRLDRLSVATVQAYLNGRLQAGKSTAKVQAIRLTLSAPLTRAMREELIPRNVARQATLPPASAAKRPPWSAAEARRLLDVAKPDPLYPAFVLLLLSGLRRGEVLGLSWRAVDFGQDVLRIEQQLSGPRTGSSWAR